MDDDYIPDELYNSISKAAELLYAQYVEELPVYKELNKLEQIDIQVEQDGTSEANVMLDEIFKQRS